MTRQELYKVFFIGLILLGLTYTYLGSALLKGGQFYVEKEFDIQSNYKESTVSLLKGSTHLKDVSFTRALPDFLDIEAKNLALSLKDSSLVLSDVSGRLITQNISIPFQFETFQLSTLYPSALVEELFFKSTIKGEIWESNIDITPVTFNLNTIPIDKLNTLFDDPLSLFSKGFLSVHSTQGWLQEGTRYSTRVQITIQNFDLRLPKSLSHLEKILVSQLFNYLREKEGLVVDVPILIDTADFTGDTTQDFIFMFKQLGTQLVKTLPHTFFESRTFSKSNIFNLTDKQIQVLEENLIELIE